MDPKQLFPEVTEIRYVHAPTNRKGYLSVELLNYMIVACEKYYNKPLSKVLLSSRGAEHLREYTDSLANQVTVPIERKVWGLDLLVEEQLNGSNYVVGVLESEPTKIIIGVY